METEMTETNDMTDFELLENKANDTAREAERLRKELETARVAMAAELREQADLKEFEAESLRKKADEIDPPQQEEAIKYVPEEPAVLKEHREITTSASKASKKRAAKKSSRNPKRKMAKKAGKAKRGRPPGSKPQEPSQAQVAKILKKKRGQSVDQIAARNG